MKPFLLIVSISLFACSQPVQHKTIIADTPKKPQVITLGLPKIGEKIEGNFIAGAQTMSATAIKTKQGQGNPVEDGAADEFEIQFSGKELPSIKAGCCDIRLINEGDLNNYGADDLSLFQAPMNGCTYSLITYSFVNGHWKIIVPSFLIPTGCARIGDNDLQKRIVSDSAAIYYYETDMSTEDEKLVKKKVTMN